MITAWHAAPMDDVVAAFGTGAEGLSDQEAQQRLLAAGANVLRPPPPASAVRILFDQFASVVVLLLVVAGGISLALGDRVEAGAIAVALAINTAIGFAVELRARRAMEALHTLDAASAIVVRSGRSRRIAAADLVPGDVIELSAGRRVAADARLIAATDLRVSEASITGESFPVPKRHDVVLAADAALADRQNMVYKGTTATAGTARAIVTATGERTEIGRIGALVASIPDERTPVERRLDALGRRLVWIVSAVAAFVALLGILQGEALPLVVQLAIALAVAAVPEGLPVVATIALATGLHRMARRHALVRRLPAVEALGATTVVCTDKTRTLTSGEMTAVRLWTAGRSIDLRGDAAGGAARRALAVAARASRSQPSQADSTQASLGDPVDAAMIAAAASAGVPVAVDGELSRTFVPFSSERQLMASFERSGGYLLASVKGAPRRVLGLCTRWQSLDGERPLTTRDRDALLAANDALAAGGLRVLAIASGGVRTASESALTDLLFVGFVGLADPPAPGVKATIDRLRRAGLRTIMLTGDQRLTAEAVGRELGLLPADTHATDIHELDAMSEAQLDAHLDRAAAFSRITPEHKLRIVQALQARGEIVAMFGDGINDAPALKKADVGVAMGVRGTDVAKEAAAIVLQDDRFETIAAAVEEGRIIYDNIQKFVFYLFSCNAAEILVLVAAGVAGLPIPLLPLQILWLNMVTDTLPALALAMEPGDPDVMYRPPRDPREAILSRAFVSSIAAYGALITASTLAAFLWGLSTSHRYAVTLSFMTLALAQIFHLGNARSDSPVVHPRHAASNLFAVGAAAVAVVLQIASVTIEPLARTLGLQPLAPRDWMLVVALAVVPAAAGQAVKLFRRHGGRRPRDGYPADRRVRVTRI